MCYGTALDHKDGCSCVADSVNQGYYPAWATDKDIHFSWLLAGQPRDTRLFSYNWMERVQYRENDQFRERDPYEHSTSGSSSSF